jgi:hypothetical protein
VLHGVADLDPGRKAVEDEASRLAFQDPDQVAVTWQVRIRGVDGRGELALQAARHGVELLWCVRHHDHAARAEYLFLKARRREQRIGVGREQYRPALRFVRPVGGGGFGQHPHARAPA